MPHTVQLCELSSRRQRGGEDPAPFEPGAEHRAAERIEDQELDAGDHLGGNALVAQPGDEFGDAARVWIVNERRAAHAPYRLSRSRKPAASTTTSRSANEAMSSVIAPALPSRAIVSSTRCIALIAARWVSLGMITT